MRFAVSLAYQSISYIIDLVSCCLDCGWGWSDAVPPYSMWEQRVTTHCRWFTVTSTHWANLVRMFSTSKYLCKRPSTWLVRKLGGLVWESRGISTGVWGVWG